MNVWKVALLILLPFYSGCRATISQAVKSEEKGITVSIQEIQREIQEYKVGPRDVLEISVFQEPDLTKITRVSQGGYISYPLLGKVKVSALTVSQIEDKITDLLEKDYLVKPQVTIFIQEYYSKKVFILGAVKKPGAYNFPAEKALTVLEVITLSGGFNEIAAVNKTKIIRLEDGVQKNIEVKITDITKDGDKSKDIILKPNDIIIVPETFF